MAISCRILHVIGADDICQGAPQLSLVCSQSEDQVAIEVIDRGPGTSQDTLKHVLSPFLTTRAVGQGARLGLYISHGAAGDLGGDLWAGNDPEGRAAFTLTLPLHENNWPGWQLSVCRR